MLCARGAEEWARLIPCTRPPFLKVVRTDHRKSLEILRDVPLESRIVKV